MLFDENYACNILICKKKETFAKMGYKNFKIGLNYQHGPYRRFEYQALIRDLWPNYCNRLSNVNVKIMSIQIEVKRDNVINP